MVFAGGDDGEQRYDTAGTNRMSAGRVFGYPTASGQRPKVVVSRASGGHGVFLDEIACGGRSGE